MLVLRLGWEVRWDMEAERAIVVDVPAAWVCILSFVELRLLEEDDDDDDDDDGDDDEEEDDDLRMFLTCVLNDQRRLD